MGISFSNSPLSTIFPDTTNSFDREIIPKNNALGFQLGLQLSQSTNPASAQWGQQMVDNSIVGASNPYQPVITPIPDQTNPISNYLTQGFNSLSQIGSQIGGKIGTAFNQAGKIGSNIKLIKEANQAVKNGEAGAKTLRAGAWGAAIGAGSDLIGSFMPQKSEYDGVHGDITQTMDSVYDGISDAAAAFGPVGMLVSGIMKGGAMLGKGVNALGGGTDAMTSTDAILGSSFLNLTPLGLVNGFGGKKSNSFTKDNEAFAQIGSSYTGSYRDANNALAKANKKYGLFSSSARRKANKQIAEALRQQNIISDIADNTQDRMNIKTAMSAINGNRYGWNMQGGYDQTAVRYGKLGMKAKQIIRELQLNPIVQYKKSAPKDWEVVPKSGKPTYQVWVKDVNPDYISKSYDLETAYNTLPYAAMQRWKFAVNSKTPKYYLDYHDGDYYPFHTGSVAPLGDDYIFLKKGTLETNPELKGELDFYNNDKNFKNNYDLSYEGDRYYYRRKKKHKLGGSIIKLNRETVISLTDPNSIPEFQNGGSFNVIPEGALHARKHNMETEGITEKGIPVVSDKPDGKVEQQAEIEREELIFRLSVTQKLEKLEKKYYSEDSSQKEKDEYALEAGKLITEEILHNTQDNAGLL